MRAEPRNIPCPKCHQANNPILHALLPDDVPLMSECPLCGGGGVVTHSRATEYSIGEYEKVRRNLRDRHAND